MGGEDDVLLSMQPKIVNSYSFSTFKRVVKEHSLPSSPRKESINAKRQEVK